MNTNQDNQEHRFPVISEADRMELTAALGLLRGHQYHGSADALERVLRGAGSLAAVQQGVPDAEPAAWVATFRPEGLLALHSVVGSNLEELKRSAPSDSVFRPLYTHPTQQGLEPCAPIRPKGMTSINARLAFNNGWVSCERHHGIRPADVGDALAMVATQAKQGGV